MTIKTKYAIGEKVYVVFRKTKQSELEVCVGDVLEILINADGIFYYIDSFYEEFKEVEIISFDDKLGLAKRVDELSKEEKLDE